MNYKQQQQPSVISHHSKTTNNLEELVYYYNDTFELLIEKNEKLHQIILQSNNKVNNTIKQYKELERNYQSEKRQIYSELEQIASNYKLYAESHKNLKKTEKRLKELFSNYTVITKELCTTNSMNNYLKKILFEIHSKINAINNFNIYNILLDLKKYVDDKWKEITTDDDDNPMLSFDINTTPITNLINNNYCRNKEHIKLNTDNNNDIHKTLVLNKVIQNPYKKYIYNNKRAMTPNTKPLNKTTDDYDYEHNETSKTNDQLFITKKLIRVTPLKRYNMN